MSETLVTIGKYLDVAEAQIAAGLLQSEGIPVYPLDINHVSANPLPGVGLGGVRLEVPARFEQEARRLLANRESSAEAELSYLATGERSEPEEVESDRLMFGILSISDRVKRRGFWIYFVLFDIVFLALVLLAIWATS
jgi:hypothetical protein